MPFFGFNFLSKNGPIFEPISGPIFEPISGPIFDHLLVLKNRRSPSFFWSKFKFLNKLHYKWGKAPICSAWTGPKSWAETRSKVVPKLDQKLYRKSTKNWTGKCHPGQAAYWTIFYARQMAHDIWLEIRRKFSKNLDFLLTNSTKILRFPKIPNSMLASQFALKFHQQAQLNELSRFRPLLSPKTR